MEKRGKGRPRRDPVRGYQIRYGTLADSLLEVIKQFQSEKDKQLIIIFLESLKPQSLIQKKKKQNNH